MRDQELSYDVLVIGSGPSLGAAIRLKQRNKIEVCLFEKGAEVGRHVLSWAVIDPRSLLPRPSL